MLPSVAATATATATASLNLTTSSLLGSGMSLTDVIKGLRGESTSEGRARFAAEAVAQCRRELRSAGGDAATAAGVRIHALTKLAHLRMLGYDEWNQGDEETSFRVVEALAAPGFKLKREANLAAVRLLTPDAPVLVLATNTFKKELRDKEPYVVGLALGSASCFASRELAQSLLLDVRDALSSTRPYVRKRGTLALYRLCLRFPEGLLEAYDALRARLEDPDPSVVSCAVNAVCELSRTTHARNVLPLAPALFKLLTTSGNNWMLIKIVKLYAALLNEEPRLARKLLEPLRHIIGSTNAKSLLYECIATATQAVRFARVAPAPDAAAAAATEETIRSVVDLCAVKLREFVRDPDQNLKYLGLVGFVELTKTTPTVAAEHKDLVLLCLSDEDVTVRLRALELLGGMATKKSVTGIVEKLLHHLREAPPGRFRDAVVETVVVACVGSSSASSASLVGGGAGAGAGGSGTSPRSRGGNDTAEETGKMDDAAARFSRIPSFEWFVAVLMDLARIGQGAHGDLLATQFIDVALRVAPVAPFAAERARELLLEQLGSPSGEVAGEGSVRPPRLFVAPEFLAACAFVACEFFPTGEAEGECETRAIELVKALLGEDARGMALFPRARSAFVHNAAKLARVSGKVAGVVVDALEPWWSFSAVSGSNVSPEVQTQAAMLSGLLSGGGLGEARDAGAGVAGVGAAAAVWGDGQPLVAVHPTAQLRIAKPAGLDLDTPFAARLSSMAVPPRSVSFRGRKPLVSPTTATTTSVGGTPATGVPGAKMSAMGEARSGGEKRPWGTHADPSPFHLGPVTPGAASVASKDKSTAKGKRRSSVSSSESSAGGDASANGEEENGLAAVPLTSSKYLPSASSAAGKKSLTSAASSAAAADAMPAATTLPPDVVLSEVRAAVLPPDALPLSAVLPPVRAAHPDAPPSLFDVDIRAGAVGGAPAKPLVEPSHRVSSSGVVAAAASEEDNQKASTSSKKKKKKGASSSSSSRSAKNKSGGANEDERDLIDFS